MIWLRRTIAFPKVTESRRLRACRVRSVQSSKSSLAALTLGAIGVVYGDIGTSVLYAVKEVFGSGHVPFTPDNIYGILSIFFWTLTVIVSLKYVVLVLRADNHGEGGLIAMLALASQAVKDKPRLRGVLLAVGIFGTSLFYGDGVITPAISVLSAVEGLEVVSPHFKQYVIPITLVVLFCLFAVQKRGTGGIGKFFGPITLVWFISIALLGVSHIVGHPEILWALSPHHALGFMWANPGTSFIILGAVVLCVTGAEALYADLGHFGKRPIRLAWFTVAMPALTLNYFGQGALLLAEPEAVKNPFYMMAPRLGADPAGGAGHHGHGDCFAGPDHRRLQRDQAGYPTGLPAPPEHPAHQRARYRADLYAAGQLGVVRGHRAGGGDVPFVEQSGRRLRHCRDAGHADHHHAHLLCDPLRLALSAGAVHRGHGLLLLWWTWRSSHRTCSSWFQGGWFPLLIGGIVFAFMMTWKEGRRLLNDKLRADAIDLKDFLESVFISPPTRVDGTAVFLTAETGAVPNALLHNLKHNKVLHQQNLFVTVHNHETPWIGLDKRLQVESPGSRLLAGGDPLWVQERP